MSYSIKVRSAGTEVGPDGTIVDVVSVRLFWNDTPIDRAVTHRRTIKPGDDITGDRTRAAKLAETARTAGNEEVVVEVRTR